MKIMADVCLWIALVELALTPLTSHPEKWHVFDIVIVVIACVCGLTMRAVDEKRAARKSDSDTSPSAFRN